MVPRNITGGQIKYQVGPTRYSIWYQMLIIIVKIAKYIGFCVYCRSLLWSPVIEGRYADIAVQVGTYYQ